MRNKTCTETSTVRPNTRNQLKKAVKSVPSSKTKSKLSDKKSKRTNSADSKDALKKKHKCCDSKCKTVAECNEPNVDEDEDGFIEIGSRSKPRKCLDPSKWKRNVQSKLKRDKYEQQSNISVPKCVHKRGPYKCREVQGEDVAWIRKIFAKRSNTHQENMYILSQIVVDSVKRRRPRNGSKAMRSATGSFYLRLKSAKRVRVCKVAFSTVLGVGRDRLTDVINFYHETGDARPEFRGGDHKFKKYGSKRDSVVAFIKKLKARESHYGRKKSSKLYLPHELKSIKNVCRIYNLDKEQPEQVKYGFFKKIFRSKFNLAFGTPRTDVCSFCLRHKHLLLVEKDQGKRNLIRGRLRIHKLRAKEFYKLLKERRLHIKSIAGDCQQNQAVPKIPDQAAYFSRQFNYYNFTLTEYVDNDGTMNFAYTWTEDQSKKGSNQIASAVFHKLMHTNLAGITILRMVFDGCGGQNKNVQMLCMLSWWLVNEAPESIERIELIFPVTGHSFLPPDRVFGRIEKDIRKKEEILSPSEYHGIIEKHETLVHFGKDWQVFDWKKYTTDHFKSTAMLPFKISQTKFFRIQRSTSDEKTVQIKADKNYRHSTSHYKPVCKKGIGFRFLRSTRILQRFCKLSGMRLTSFPEPVKENVVINEAKLDDVYSLLRNRFGENWQGDERLSYFTQFFDSNYKPSRTQQTEEYDCDNFEELCSCCEEDEETYFL